MRSLLRIYRFVGPYRWQAISALTLLVGMVAADLLIPRLAQRVIDEGISVGNLPLIWSTSATMVAAAALSAVFAVANSVLSVRVGQGFAADVREALFRKVQSFSPAELDRFPTGQLLVRSTSDVHMVQMIVAMSLRIMTRAPIWVLGSVVLLVITSRELALMMAAFVPVIVLLVWLFARRARPMFTQVQERLDRLNTVLQENLAGVRVVRAFHRAEHEKRRFEEANEALTLRQIRVMRLLAVLIPTMMLIVNLGIVGAVWLGGGAVLDGRLTAGQVVASVNYLVFALFPLMMLAGMLGPLAAAEASATRILEVLETEPSVRGGSRVPPTQRGRVTFEGVAFGYDGGAPVLENIDLVAEPGETVAVLGATGSGKSTLVQLIPRFYDVRAGRITVDGVDVRELPLRDLRGRIGMVLQESVLFTGTIRENICFGRPDASDAEMIAAAKAAQAHAFIDALPEGYETLIGPRGLTLSGGQRQRIAIARALVVRPQVLILDDSTSAVDVETEVRLQDALDRLLRESDRSTTRFVVAQRISTVLLADKIIVLDKGRIAALGSHGTLLAESSLYRDIYRSQLDEPEEAVHG